MFRLSRLVFPKGSSYNLPLLSQWNQSKQVMVEFSIVPDKKEALQEKRTPKSNNQGIIQGYLKGDVLQELNDIERSDDVKELIQNSKNSEPTAMLKLLKRVAQSGKRPITLLDHVFYVLQKNASAFSPRQISDVLYSCARLSYRNEGFIMSLTKSLKEGSTDFSPSVLRSILHSLGALRYRDCELLDILLNSLSSQNPDIKTSVECLMSLSFLNYPCSYANSLAEYLTKLSEIDYQQTSQYINFVWACVILNQMEYIAETHIPKVTSKAFLSQLSVSGYHPGIALKLLNIQGAAQQFSQKSSETNLANNVYKMPFKNAPYKKSPLFDSVLDTLSYILPGNGYFRTAADTGAGFCIDFEYAINSKNHPVPLNKGNRTKVGILLLEYKDICSDNSPTGIFAFKLKVLEQQRYKPIVLHYAEYPLGSLLSAKIDFLRQKLSNVDINSVQKSSQNVN